MLLIDRSKAIRMIYAIAGDKNISDELLHQIIYNHFNIESIANADSEQLEKILGLLNKEVKVEVNAQIYMVYKRAKKWGIQKEAIDTFVHNKFKKKSVFDLTSKQRRGLIKVVFSMIEKKKQLWIRENNYIMYDGKICFVSLYKYENGEDCLVVKDLKTKEMQIVATEQHNLDDPCVLINVRAHHGYALYDELVKSKIITPVLSSYAYGYITEEFRKAKKNEKDNI